MGAHISEKNASRAQGFLGVGSQGLGLPENSLPPSSSSSSRSRLSVISGSKPWLTRGHRSSGKGGFPENGALSGLSL